MLTGPVSNAHNPRRTGSVHIHLGVSPGIPATAATASLLCVPTPDAPPPSLAADGLRSLGFLLLGTISGTALLRPAPPAAATSPRLSLPGSHIPLPCCWKRSRPGRSPGWTNQPHV